MDYKEKLIKRIKKDSYNKVKHIEDNKYILEDLQESYYEFFTLKDLGKGNFEKVYYRNGEIIDIKKYKIKDLGKGKYMISEDEYEIYYNKKDELHRDDDKPAFIRFNIKSGIDIKSFFKNGKQYRKNNKAVSIYYYKNSKNIYRKTYIKKDGTTIFKYYFENGDLKNISYYNESWKLHRDGDKPAVIDYDEFGNTYEKFYKNGSHQYFKTFWKKFGFFNLISTVSLVEKITVLYTVVEGLNPSLCSK